MGPVGWGDGAGLLRGAVQDAGDSTEPAGHPVGRLPPRGLVTGRFVPGMVVSGRGPAVVPTDPVGRGHAAGAAVGRGVTPPARRPGRLAHGRFRLSRYCCRMTTAAAWSITGRCLRLSMPPSRR